MKEITYLELPAAWASALVDADKSGLTISEEFEFNCWCAKNPEFTGPACCSDDSHFGQFDFGSGLKFCDLLDYAYLEGCNL